ncbi:hypothetical protein MPRS_00010 [Mycobacterium paraseoulense]|nr:hypothetical protein [Mycobacterium paraseoulense]BBZ68908.1 hypothetical protein MPRS_00010 [Mycobacterium paraseoulense]
MLYETGELDEAAELLEESYHLGPERYVVGAKAAQGDREAAAGRLDAGMAVAEKLRLPRLAAAITHERVRQGLPIDPAEAARLRAGGGIPRAGDGIATLTAELDAASGIRLLARSHAGDDRDEACRRALLAGIDPPARPLAALQARLLLVEIRTAARTRRTTSRRCAPCAPSMDCRGCSSTRASVDGRTRKDGGMASNQEGIGILKLECPQGHPVGRILKTPRIRRFNTIPARWWGLAGSGRMKMTSRSSTRSAGTATSRWATPRPRCR